MSIKILFINSPLKKYPENGRSEFYEIIPPYGLLYCATVCANILGMEKVKVLDAEYHGMSIKGILDYILAVSPKYIAINATSVNFYVVKEIISKINTNKSVIVGGSHAILSPNDFFDKTTINKILFVCNGAGESVYYQFFNDVPIDKISSISYFNGNTIVSNSNVFIYNIDELIVSREFLNYDPCKWDDSNTIESFMLTSRGCMYSCSFCAANVICKNKIIFRTEKAILAELEYLKKYGVNYIRFIDDLFMVSQERLGQLCSCIFKVGWNKSNFGFEATGRINTLKNLDDNSWCMLAEAGCKELEIGVESGSEKILKFMNKNNCINDLIYIVEKAVKYEIKVKAFIMCGYIYETTEDLEKTILLCKKLKEFAGNYIRFSAVPAKVYPKTFLYKQVMKLEKVKLMNKNWIYNTIEVDLAEYFHILNNDLKYILSKRTRYNSMHEINMQPITLSELSNCANTKEVLMALIDIALISDNKKTLFWRYKNGK